ncbi:MAG TPA: class I adenylate-forming enzyme family protein [Trebonia sp.]|nr:class I adenylate-forming enzyme family protein [Trebonia sp.]
MSAGGGLLPLQLLRETAGRSPRAVLFIEDTRSTTAQALVELVEARIEAYRRAGIGPGCRVGTVAWPAASFTADVLAVLALEAVVVPLPRQMSEWERERTEALTSVTHLAAPLDWQLLPGAGEQLAGRRLIVRKPPGEDLAGGAASAQLTSGTSGQTRVALRMASALMTEAASYRAALDLAPGTVLACPVPLHHAYGFGLAALAAPLAGATTLVTSTDRPRMLLRALDQHDVTLVAGVPPMLRLLAEAATGAPRRSIGYLTAGMPLDPRTAELVGTVLRGRIGEVYGTTETGPICLRPPVSWQEARSLGSPLPGVRVDLRPLDDAGEPQPSPGESGGLASGLVVVHSPTVMTGYLCQDRVDASPVAGGFVVGDIARRTPDGLVIVGRVANCVNVGGTKVSPEEVEAVLLEFPTVRSCLVDGVPDERLGQRIRATVTPADVDLSALQAFCRQRLSRSKLPSRFLSIETLETTATGKVIRPARQPAPSSPR